MSRKSPHLEKVRRRRELIEQQGRSLLSWLDRLRVSDQTFLVIYATLIGALAGVVSALFRNAIALVRDLCFGTDDVIHVMIHMPAAWRFTLPALGGLLMGILAVWVFRRPKMGGVPEVIEQATRGGGTTSVRSIFPTFINSVIVIGSGGSAGREGPIVAMGASIGTLIGRVFKLSTQRRRVALGCGAAAGIAAAFNAPLAGVFFSLEVVLAGDFQVRTLSPIVLSSVVGTVVLRALMGNHLAFTLPPYQLVSGRELLFYAVLGILAGVVARAFVMAHEHSHQFFEKLPLPLWIKPAIGGLAVGVIGIWLPQVYGNGYDFMQQALAGKMTLALLAALVVGKIVATALTLGSGGWGGDLAPSLFIGAMLGGTVGDVVHGTFPAVTATPGAYAVVGMGAVLAAVIHAPITGILMLFEVTNNYKVILPVMIACVLATTISRLLSPLSIYGEALAKRGIYLWEGREVRVMQDLKVENVMSRDVETVRQSAHFREILDRLTHSKQLFFPVVDDDDKLLGVLNFHQYRELLFEEDLADLVVAGEMVDKELAFLYPDDSVQTAIELFHGLDWDEVPVVNRADRKVIGRVTRRQVIDAYNREVVKRSWTA